MRSQQNGQGLQKSTATRPRAYRENAFGTADSPVEIVSVEGVPDRKPRLNDLTSRGSVPTALNRATNPRDESRGTITVPGFLRTQTVT